MYSHVTTVCCSLVRISPDVADALMLSFAKEGYSADLKEDTDELFERHGIFPSVT